MSEQIRIKKKDKVIYTYNGSKNETAFPDFVMICKMTQPELKAYLSKELEKYYKTIVNKNGFLYAKGDDVLLTAHMDTVHKEPVKDFYEEEKDGQHIISSPQGIGGDDRCGVYIIMKILSETKFRPSILFCEDEEIGGIGSTKFCKTDFIEELNEMKFFVELDRANRNDAVYYDDENMDFHRWINEMTGYETSFGSFSDISELCPEAGVSGVNLSCGYYNPHTLGEYVIVEEMLNTAEAVKKLLKKAKKLDSYFEYISSYGYKYGYDFWSQSDCRDHALYIAFREYDPKLQNIVDQETVVEDESIDRCWHRFFVEHTSVCFNDIYDFEEYDI